MIEVSEKQLQRYIREYLNVLHVKNSETTHEQKCGMYFVILKNYLNGRDLTPETVISYLNMCMKSGSNIPLYDVIMQIYMFLGWLHSISELDWRLYFGINIPLKPQMWRDSARTPVPYSIEEYFTYIQSCNAVFSYAQKKYQDESTLANLQLYAAIALLLDTGIRSEELIRVSGADLHYFCRDGVVTSEDHGENITGDRFLLLNESVAPILRLRILYGEKKIFLNKRGDSLTAAVLRRNIALLAKEISQNCTPKMFRAVKVVEFFKSDLQLEQIAYQLGVGRQAVELLYSQYKEWK